MLSQPLHFAANSKSILGPLWQKSNWFTDHLKVMGDMFFHFSKY